MEGLFVGMVLALVMIAIVAIIVVSFICIIIKLTLYLGIAFLSIFLVKKTIRLVANYIN